MLGCLPNTMAASKRRPHDHNRLKVYSSCAIGKLIDKNKVVNRAEAFR